MRQFFLRIATCLFALLILSTAARADALAGQVPDDALLFISWQGANNLQAQYAQSRLHDIMADSTLQSAFAKAIDDLESAPRTDPQAKPFLEALKSVRKMLAYPTALYVGPVLAGPQPAPQIVLLCQAGDNSASLATELQNLLPNAPPPGAPPFKIRQSNGYLLLELGNVSAKMDALLAPNANPRSALADLPAYKAALAQVQPDAALTVYGDLASITDQVDQIIGRFSMTPPGAPPPPWIAANLRKTLNLDAFTQVALTAGFDGRDWCTCAFVGLKGMPDGLASLFFTKPLDESLFKNAPESTAWLMAARFDFGALYDQIVHVAGTIDPRTVQALPAAKAIIQQQIGIDPEADILRPLGDQWLAFTAPAVSGTSLLGITLVSPLKDAPRLSTAIDALAPKITAALSAQIPPDAPVHLGINQYTTDGIKITYANLMLNPAIAIHDGKLYATLLPQGILSAIDLEKSGKSILDNPKFTEFRKRLAVPNPSTLVYADLSVSGPNSYALLSALSGFFGVFTTEPQPPTLPPLSKLYPHLTTAGAATWNDAAGWHSKSIEPFPGAMLLAGGQQNLGLASAPIMTAILLPALSHARGIAGRTAEAANIRQLLMGSLIYANDHTGQLPDDLAQLVALNLATPRNLVAPNSGHTPMVLTADQVQKMAEDWKVLLPEAAVHCDFVYVGTGLKSDSAGPSLILIYTDPAKVNVSDGMNIGYADGHVEFVRPDRFREQFEASNKTRDAAHLKPLTLDDRGLPTTDKK